jgi:hypothetical protein
VSNFRTQADLIDEVLANLGARATGQPSAPEDITAVSEKLPSILLSLAAQEIVYVPDPNNIPGQWFSPLADIVAFSLVSKFGVSGEDLARLAALGSTDPSNPGSSVRALQVMQYGRPTFEPQRALYF